MTCGRGRSPRPERDRLAAAYADEHLRAEAAAAAGYVDEIVEPVGDAKAACVGAEGAGEASFVILEGKRLLITGVITKDSIAYHVAEQAQREGASMVLTSFGRVRRMTERAAKRLPDPADVLELDVNKPEDFDGARRGPGRALGRA